MPETIAFHNIDPELYRHPGEKEALASLKKLPGFDKALAVMSEGIMSRAERQIELASMARVSPGVYPAMDEIWTDTCARFGIGEIPLHICLHPPQPWAIRGGNDNPRVILSSDWLDLLPEDEMGALLAMLAGSIRLGNATYLGAADFLRRLSDFSGLAGAPAAVLSWGLENWRRYASFSSDRAAALYHGDPRKVLTFLERLAGANRRAWGGVDDPDRLRLQAMEALSMDKDWANNRWRRFAVAMNRQNNISLIRRLDLQEWHATGVPAKILAGEKIAPEEAAKGGTKYEDPGLAFWGEFACGQDGADDKKCPMSDLLGTAEKGVNAFWKAGEAFFKSLQNNL